MDEMQYTENPVQPKKKKKTGLILGITIPVLIVLIVVGVIFGISASKEAKYEEALQMLDDGDIADAIEIHAELGDYEDLADEISDAAASQCKKLLKKGSYSKVAKLYNTVVEYPDAIEQMDKQVKKHITSVLVEFASETLAEIYDAFGDDERICSMIQELAHDNIEEMGEDGIANIAIFCRKLREEDIRLDAVDGALTQYICDNIAERDYTDAFTYYNVLTDNPECLEQIHNAYAAKVKEFLDNTQFQYALEIYGWLEAYDVQIEQVSTAIYDCAQALMEKEAYDDAQELFSELADSDPTYGKEAKYMNSLAMLHVYISNRQYDDARDLINRQYGETGEKLLAVFLEYCADKTFLADLEAALVARAALVDAGATEQELVDLEMEYLWKYQTMPFYDEELRELAMEYLEGLGLQQSALQYDVNSEEYYTFYYCWNLGAAQRYVALDALHSDHGFTPKDERVQSVLGIGERMMLWIEAWNEIHISMSNQLWNWGPYWNGSHYCLDLYNNTAYTFSFTVYEQFYGAGDVLLHDYLQDVYTLAPGQSVQVIIDYPDMDVYYWYIDWNIYDIYFDGVMLG